VCKRESVRVCERGGPSLIECEREGGPVVERGRALPSLARLPLPHQPDVEMWAERERHLQCPRYRAITAPIRQSRPVSGLLDTPSRPDIRRNPLCPYRGAYWLSFRWTVPFSLGSGHGGYHARFLEGVAKSQSPKAKVYKVNRRHM
jgi:hypothetical protein